MFFLFFFVKTIFSFFFLNFSVRFERIKKGAIIVVLFHTWGQELFFSLKKFVYVNLTFTYYSYLIILLYINNNIDIYKKNVIDNKVRYLKDPLFLGPFDLS